MADWLDTGDAKCESPAPMKLDGGQYIPPTQRQRLMQKKQALEASLKQVNEALAALDAHPDLEEFAIKLARAL